VRKKYSCLRCEQAGENPQIEAAAKAETAIEKGFAAPGLLAYIVISKFADYGAVPIDNNVSEREMKRVVLNRKNSLFVGNPRGGRTAAILASLTSSCRRHEMDPQLYFMQLLMNLPSWPANDLDAWLPDRWKQAHADRCAALEIPPLDS
jgi:transposase